jgi:hypothetical protein
MSSSSETGHLTTISNFDELIQIATLHAGKYNPSNAALQITVLDGISTEAHQSINIINDLLPKYSIPSANREDAFKPLPKFCTRVLNALKVSGVSDTIIDGAQTINRKIQGERAIPKKTEEEKLALKEQGKEVNEISTSQLSYDNRLNNFDKLIKYLSNITEYAPNEAELKLVAIKDIYANLQDKNSAAKEVGEPLTNARIARNKILYTPKTGLVDTALDVKKYILSVFGASSPEYKQASRLKFHNIK